ncbi:MAG TPA: hypothetical protein VGV67_07535 [Solirubrobacteraceae bacterium]|nr:hypothetical protein [Solirubrobacteraceae bacterium]
MKSDVDKAAHKSPSKRLRRSIGVVTLIVLTATAIGAISASAGSRGGPNHGPNQLVGSWIVSVDRGPALPALKSLQTYTRGHGVVETANGGATARSASHGAWERVDGRQYATTNVFFRYDPATGAYLGTVKLRHTLELSPDGQSFTGFSVPEFRDPAGNLLPGSNSRRDAVAGERIHVEAPPALP